MDNKSFEDLYNHTGTPFQYHCLSILKNTPSWQGVPEFSFTFLPLNKHSSIDILAIKCPASSKEEPPPPGSDLSLCFIECKRAFPSIKYWVFSRSPDKFPCFPTFISKNLKPEKIKSGDKDYEYLKLLPDVQHGGLLPLLGYNRKEDLDFCLQGTEFKISENGKLTDVNREREEMIYKPLEQIHQALNTLFREFNHYPPHIEGLNFPKNLKRIWFFPIIITTAELLIANYKPEDVDINTGTIEKSKISFEPKKWLTYEFALPNNFKYSGSFEILPYNLLVKGDFEEKETKLDIDRLTTFFVNSNHWEEFLTNFNFYF